ncbi:hypothetical protein EPD60_10760 [Flaviaesturariibacter flavus]|uniref:Outer membrane protein beta-barrel domain-containing protein n=1 Tax=Flaviaesturariibacter flavus TaxID=2502780 RepID=A0A4R1BBR8_9BACT|nr:hypothetical protein [Flaviaesturariibacter flavus]TCJ14461.1 hypothetical protein EPD60_10760 [Flaviaesturariibacter flavus]
MKRTILTLILCSSLTLLWAQRDTTAPHGFQKSRLFTGGSFSLGFGTGYFLGGISPMLGYNLTSWLDAGIGLNYTYTQQRYIYSANDKARQTLYGGGVFTRIFPVHFLYAQAQYEHNFINYKYYPGDGAADFKQDYSAPSMLVGLGYTSGRNSGGPYGFVSVLWDVLKDPNSPYVDNQGHPQMQFRAGLNIPLFSGKRNNDFDRGGPLKR